MRLSSSFAVRCSAVALFAAAPVVLAAQQGGTPPTPRTDSLRMAQRLDSDGKHGEARAIFQRLIDNAPDPAAKAAAQRRMAMSYAFEGNCTQTTRYEEMVIDYWKTREAAEPQNAFYQQGEMANEAARVCIDAGDLKAAEKLYLRGQELGLREPQPRTHPASLWEFRTVHAQARLAARIGEAEAARGYVARARRILDADSAMASQQERFYPYLVGYVALYTNDLATAESSFRAALAMPGNANDPFLYALLGMTLEKKKDAVAAREMYQKTFDLSGGHNPPAAFSRPFARRKLNGR
jgi:tetratricopeptide (TPR) repeat protein